MAQMEGYHYDEFQVYVNLPPGTDLGKIIDVGCQALGIEVDDTKEINWIDSHYY